MKAPVYLDYAATTPVDPAVARAMSAVLESGGDHGNAASITHVFGRRAQARIETARAQVAALIGARPDEIVFTSGATESNNLAVLGIARANADRGRHIVTSRIEHKAVLDPCRQLEREGFAVTYVAPDSAGRVAPDAVRAALRPNTVLVTVMHVNNETGVVQDVRAIGNACRERGVPFHTDAAQSVGKLPVDVATLPVDLLSFTAHKLYGPKGIGALYVRSQIRPALRPVIFGGGQERSLRPGTLATHQIIGFGVACDLVAAATGAEQARIASLRDRLWGLLRSLDKVHLNGEGADRVAGILNVSFEGVEGESLVAGLADVAVTTGSACSSASGEPSYVLRALGRSTQLAQSSLRFSLGRWTTEADIDRAAAAVRAQVGRLRSVSPAVSGPLRPLARSSPASEGYGCASVEYELDTLSPAARRYFDALPGAGVALVPGEKDALAAAGELLVGEAGGPADEVWVRFHLRVRGGLVTAALFQACACPHTLAVAAWLTGQLPGRSREGLVPAAPAEWLDAMNVPVEKLGRLLVVEDALRDALQHWA